MKKRIEMFKDEVKHIYDLMDKQRRIEGEIELIEYDLANVKGVDYSKISGGAYNQSAIEQKRLALIEEKEKKEKEMKRVKENINAICVVLNNMTNEERALILETLAEKRTYRQVCKERNISNTSSLFVLIESIIEKAIKKSGY